MHRLLDLQDDDPTRLGDPDPKLDHVLYQDLVEIVPLIQSLIDRKASATSFTRRAAVAYTKTPSREALSKSVPGANGANSIKEKKTRENAGNEADADSVLSFASRASAEKDHEELDALRVQLEELRRKLLEKEEELVALEVAKKEARAVEAWFEEVTRQAAEKDCLIKASQRQLSDAKVKLADKQAALEKLLWEGMTSSRSAEKLRAELESLRGEISSFVILLGSSVKTNPSENTEDHYFPPCNVDQLSYIEDWDETQMRQIEAARKAYEAAVIAAKEQQDEESIAAAASARLYLRSFVLKT